MPGVTWMSDAQKEFSQGHLASYNEAVLKGRKAIRKWFRAFEVLWIEKFPLKPDLVDQDKLGTHVLEKDYVLTTEEAKTYRGAMEFRAGQLRTWFRYHHKKTYGDVGAGVGGGNKNGVTHAAKAFVSKQRRAHKRIEVFYQLNQEWLDPMITTAMTDYSANLGKGELKEEDIEEESDKDGGDGAADEEKDGPTAVANRAAARTRGWNLTIRNEVIQREFDAASDEALRAVEEAVNQEKLDLEREADLERSGCGLARDPKLRKEALERVQAFMVENGRTMWNQAAMATITIGVAPDCDKPGKLKSIIVAHGKNSDGLLFTDVDPDIIRKTVTQLRSWARNNIFGPDQVADAVAKHEEHLTKLEEDTKTTKTTKKAPSEDPKSSTPTPPSPPVASPTNFVSGSATPKGSTGAKNSTPVAKAATKGSERVAENVANVDSGLKISPSNAELAPKGPIQKGTSPSNASPSTTLPDTSLNNSGSPAPSPEGEPSEPPPTVKPRPRPVPVKKTPPTVKDSGDGVQGEHPLPKLPQGFQPLPGDSLPRTQATSIVLPPPGDTNLPVFTSLPSTTAPCSSLPLTPPPAPSTNAFNPAGGPTEAMAVGLHRAGWVAPEEGFDHVLGSAGIHPERGDLSQGQDKEESPGQGQDDEGQAIPEDWDEEDMQGEGQGGELEEDAAGASFNGEEFWASLKTNIPSTTKAKDAASTETKVPVKKRARKTKGSTKGRKAPARKAASDTTDPAAATSLGQQTSGLAVDAPPPPKRKTAPKGPTIDTPPSPKRKAPPSGDDSLEGGRSKRIRKSVTLPDGTALVGPSRGVKSKAPAQHKSDARTKRGKTG